MKLRDWRKAQGLTATQVAEQLGVTQPTVSRMENDKLWPDKALMEAIVTLSKGEVTPNDFLPSTSENSEAPQQEAA